MTCPSCKREIKIVAKGYCRACYERFHKTGTTEYQRKGKRTPCHIKDCENDAITKGLCDKHRKRLERHGHTEDTRPDSWGSVEKHPLLHSWRWMQRYSGMHDICPQWEDDFLQFALDVGDKPSSKHKFYRADDTKPHGPGNFVWKLSVTERVEGEDDRTFKNRRAKVYRAVRKEAHTGYDLKKNYSLTLAEYDALLQKQGGCCAICEKDETMKIKGKVIRLSVDHCHETGKVRGLLCTRCNTGLGNFSDDIDRLKQAIDYLGK